jgi:transcriptional regulator with XRE-family HTH domain
MAGVNHGDTIEQVRAFGSNLRRARLRAGYTQAELSSATEGQVSPPVPIDRAAISRLECGERAPDMPTMLRICAALGVKPTALLRGIGPSDSPRSVPRHDKRSGDEPAKLFGMNLRWARTRAGISQERLALDAKVDRAAISVYENGRREPNLRTVLKLALKLEIRPALLLGGIAWSDGTTARTATQAVHNSPPTTSLSGSSQTRH